MNDNDTESSDEFMINPCLSKHLFPSRQIKLLSHPTPVSL